MDLIRQAIEARQRLSFTYKSDRRLVEPYILGRDDAGKLILSAVQTQGGSGKGFRTFEIDGLSLVTLAEGRPFAVSPDYNPRDRLFQHVISQVPPPL